MKGIENIIKKIADEASVESEKILSDARAEADAILSSYEKKVAEKKADAVSRAVSRAEEARLRLVGGYRLDERQKTLAKKQELIASAFDAAYEKLNALEGEERADILARLALRAANGAAGEIILSAEDKEKLADEISEKISENAELKISDEVRPISGGLIFKRGATEVNCTFCALIDEMREVMSREVADILFG